MVFTRSQTAKARSLQAQVTAQVRPIPPIIPAPQVQPVPPIIPAPQVQPAPSVQDTPKVEPAVPVEPATQVEKTTKVKVALIAETAPQDETELQIEEAPLIEPESQVEAVGQPETAPQVEAVRQLEVNSQLITAPTPLPLLIDVRKTSPYPIDETFQPPTEKVTDRRFTTSEPHDDRNLKLENEQNLADELPSTIVSKRTTGERKLSKDKSYSTKKIAGQITKPTTYKLEKERELKIEATWTLKHESPCTPINETAGGIKIFKLDEQNPPCKSEMNESKKRKRLSTSEEAFDAASTKLSQATFDRQKFQASGFLELEGARAPNLINEIHQIWQKANFRPPSLAKEHEFDAFYTTIEPALRLASMWLTGVEYRAFWAPLMTGHIEAMTLETKWLEIIQPESWPACLTKMNAFIQGHHHYFNFGPLTRSWALTEPKDTIFRRSRTTLHEDFFHVSLTTFKTATPSQQLRYLFLLAMQLIEQLAHIIHHKRRLEENFVAVIRESTGLFPHSSTTAAPRVHLGLAWEHFLLGGRLQLLHHITAIPTPLALDGLALLPMAVARNDKNPSKDAQQRISPLPMQWISDFFCQEWWTAIRTAPEYPPSSRTVSESNGEPSEG